MYVNKWILFKAEEVAVRKEYKELEVQTDETYIEQMKSAMVTKETLLEDEMNKLREERNKKEEKKRLKKLKKNASLTVIDWYVEMFQILIFLAIQHLLTSLSSFHKHKKVVHTIGSMQ